MEQYKTNRTGLYIMVVIIILCVWSIEDKVDDVNKKLDIIMKHMNIPTIEEEKLIRNKKIPQKQDGENHDI